MNTWQAKLLPYQKLTEDQINLLNDLEILFPTEDSLVEWISQANIKGLLTDKEWDALDTAMHPNLIKVKA